MGWERARLDPVVANHECPMPSVETRPMGTVPFRWLELPVDWWQCRSRAFGLPETRVAGQQLPGRQKLSGRFQLGILPSVEAC